MEKISLQSKLAIFLVNCDTYGVDTIVIIYA